MDLFEQMVCEFLCANGKAFVCTQFDCAWDAGTGTGGSSPDFVVIDPWCNGDRPGDIIVVEVTTAFTINSLVTKIKDRKNRWYAPINSRLADKFPGYDMRTIVFLRGESVDWAYGKFPSEDDHDVTFCAIEDTAFPYRFSEKRSYGLPKRRIT